MLTRTTTVVVGAGASVDFGLPTGTELIRKIFAHLTDRNNEFGSTYGSTAMIKAMMHFSKEHSRNWGNYYFAGQKLANILRGQPVSIDNVVHTHAEDADLAAVAKLAIALVISESEHSGSLREQNVLELKSSPKGLNSWLHYFLVRNFTGFTVSNRLQALQNLKFVVFNYDRCVEQLLRQVYANCFHLDDSTAIEEIQSIDIVHPYGFLGGLPKTGIGGEFAFGSAPSPEKILQMAQRLRTFTEGVEDKKLQLSVHQAISGSDAIVFVGFGYLALNRQLLIHNSLRERTRIVFGSAYAVPPESARQLRQTVSTEFNSSGAYGFDPTQNSLSFLKEYEQLLFR